MIVGYCFGIRSERRLCGSLAAGGSGARAKASCRAGLIPADAAPVRLGRATGAWSRRVCCWMRRRGRSGERIMRLSVAAGFARRQFLQGACAGVASLVPACGRAEPAMRLLHPRELRVGTYFVNPPFEFIDSGARVGFDVDLMDAIAGKLQLRPVFVDTRWEVILGEMERNRFDCIIGGITITPNREKVLDWSLHGNDAEPDCGCAPDAAGHQPCRPQDRHRWRAGRDHGLRRRSRAASRRTGRGGQGLPFRSYRRRHDRSGGGADRRGHEGLSGRRLPSPGRRQGSRLSRRFRPTVNRSGSVSIETIRACSPG
jgi:hypothetical protein